MTTLVQLPCGPQSTDALMLFLSSKIRPSKPVTLQAGTNLHGRYRVLRRIGRGGMGAVYEAVDTRLRNTVAVKQLEIAGTAAERAFEREAQLLAGLRHPALPVVIDYFLAADDAFLVMQYIEGEDLERHLARVQRPCGRDDVIAWASAILDGLEYLHSHTPPIVHRDVKPSNVKRTPTGDVVLLDFGLAKGRLNSDDTVASANHSLYGFTLQYAPLEQIDGRGTDSRSDLFALGATLYHLATGVMPPTAVQRSRAVRNGLPDPLVAADVVHPAVGPVLSAALSRALQLEPADRFASAAEMRSALSAIGAPAPRPAKPQTADRRVDAALPSQMEVGRQTDLIVQIRFADSPLLGIEDWPTKRRPEEVEQQSEPLQVTHLVDPATGRLAPARVRIKIVASDFAVDGDAARLIEVPVDTYSKRIAFLLTPRRAGFCRVNIEVYALDTLYLGTVAVEAEAVATSVVVPDLTVANVVLGAFAVEPTLSLAPTAIVGDAPTPIRPAASVSMPVRDDEAPAATTVIYRSVAPAPPATRTSAVAPTERLSDARPVPAAAPPEPTMSRSARITAFGGAAAAVLVAGVVIIAWPFGDRTVPTKAIPPLVSNPGGAMTRAAAPAPPASVRTPAAVTTSTIPQASIAPSPAALPPMPDRVDPKRLKAIQLMNAAATLEASGDLTEAVELYERARQLDPSSTAVAKAIRRVRARMKEEGPAAFKNARQFDALGRRDGAITWYERAVKMLPDDDPNKKTAQERLDALRKVK